MTNVKQLDTTVNQGPRGNEQAVKKVFDTWIANFTAKLDKVRQPSE